MTWWLLFVKDRRPFRYIRAEPPCWKGELQWWRLIFGWEAGQ